MALLQEWQKIAYNEQADRAKLQKFWQDYFLVEKGIYEKLLDHPDEEVSGTVKELADKYADTTSVKASKMMFDCAGVRYHQYHRTGRKVEIEL